ncbi:MAG TPA: 4-hydroxy-tetrahydrodipicolinate synthase [Oscillospiraceae bacterium]|nr:4-hydroxy-tetrahydrodipicolinate synthase [Oscillospiraceae bacterium]
MIAPFGEVLTAMITPFTDDGEVNYEEAVRLATYLADNGSDAIVVAGTTGESPTLTDEEKIKLFTTVAEAVKGKAKVLAGTGANSTKHSVELTKKAETSGVDGIMLVVPYYNKPTQEGLYQHFAAIAKATTLPVLLYNVPGRTSLNMAAETTVRLAAAVTNIVAIKEASGNLEQIARIRSTAPPDFAIYSGDDALTLPILAVGGCGIVSVASHVAGKEIKKMVSAYRAGDTATALTIHLRLLPLFKAMFMVTNPIPVKTAMHMLGFKTDVLRLPLVAPTLVEKAPLEEVLTRMGYL